jgi:hypothetical protein
VTQTPGLRWYWRSAPTVRRSAEKRPLVLFEAVERKLAREVRHKSLGTLPKLIFYIKSLNFYFKKKVLFVLFEYLLNKKFKIIF